MSKIQDHTDQNKGKSRGDISRRDLLRIGTLATGALSATTVLGNKSYPYENAGPDETIEVNSCCQFCQVRCTTIVQVRNGRAVNVYGNPGNYWTEGGLCPKGQAVVELTYSPHRLLYPLIRQGSSWKRIPYAEAIDLVSEKILKLKAESPEDCAHQVALFAPMWESRESELVTTMFMRLSGFPDIYHPGDTCIGNAGTALRLCLGSGITPTTLDEVLNTRVLILWGVNLAETYPLYTRWIDKARAKGVRVIYIDPRRTPTSNHCDWQLTPRPGTDGALALGVIRSIIRENRHDKDYIAKHVNGFEELSASCENYTPAKVAEICRLSEEQVQQLTAHCGKDAKTIIYMGASLSRYTNSIQSVRAIIALQAITGNLSGPGKGMMIVQGGKPGGGEAFEDRFRSPDLGPALGFRKTLYNMERKRLKLLFLNSSYRRYPDANRVKKAIGNVDFVVYRGFFMDEEAQLANLIMPATMVFESPGSQYGNQRQVVWKEQAIQSPGETVGDGTFYRDLAKKTLKGKFPDFERAEDVYEFFRVQSPTWSGLTIERLKGHPTGIAWPCPSTDHPGTKGTLYPEDRFLTSDGKVDLITGALGPIRWAEPEGGPGSTDAAGDFPLILIQGKVVHHWQHTLTNWSAYMAQFSDGNYVQVHPETARGLGIEDGNWVYLETGNGKIRAKARLSELILPGVVWTPSHPQPSAPFRGNSGETINAIIPSQWDLVGAQYNGFGCKLTKA
jgi:anaerobic selenocysteine-containing dehydrogenase